MSDPTDPDVVVDARGLLCPQPVIMLGRAARQIGTGTIAVLADDPAARTDIPAWCEMRQAELVLTQDLPDHVRFVVRVHG